MIWNGQKTCFQQIPKQKKFFTQATCAQPGQPTAMHRGGGRDHFSRAEPVLSPAEIFILHFALKMKDILFSTISANKIFLPARTRTQPGQPTAMHRRGGRDHFSRAEPVLSPAKIFILHFAFKIYYWLPRSFSVKLASI